MPIGSVSLASSNRNRPMGVLPGLWSAITAVASRSHALQSSDLLPLIGRDEEMELLLRRWERTRRGEGQVVLLSGEAGIGKSRLTVALLEQGGPSRAA